MSPAIERNGGQLSDTMFSMHTLHNSDFVRSNYLLWIGLASTNLGAEMSLH